MEVKEDELGIPVTACRNITIPLRTGGVFHVDMNATFNTNQVLTPHILYFEEMPMVNPHEIVIPPICDENDKFMHVMHITNVGTEKSCYIKKGDVVAFAQPKSDTVQYMDVLGPKHEIKQHLEVRPRNWIPKTSNVTLIEVNKTFTHIGNTVDGKDNLLTLIDLHMKRKVINENSENLLKSRENEERSREVTESLIDIKSDFERKEVQKHSDNKENLHES